MIIANEEQFNRVKNIFPLFKITENIYITRLYANKELHPFGYHIPILLIVRRKK